MRSPLALLEINQHDQRTGRNTREWLVVRTAGAARGMPAHRVIFLREPTPEERGTVEACLAPGRIAASHSLKDLLEKAWAYEELRK